MKSKLLGTVHKSDNLEKAWRVIQANGRTSTSESVKLDLERFSENAPKHLRSIQSRLSKSRFAFEKAKGVPVPKRDERGKKTGKYRPIVLASVESRIVQRALLNVLLDVDELKPIANTPFSFGGVRSERKTDRSGTRQPRTESLSAVPAAIDAVLNAIRDGGRYVATADIQSFFTRIQKSSAVEIIRTVTDDLEFTSFFEQAITVELHNLAELRELAVDFPTQDLGVAQGNSLSPLLGNMILAEFDKFMNDGDCRCVRYIDDFIIVAPTEKAGNSRLRKATEFLKGLGMNLAPDKSSKGAIHIDQGFDFLGINIQSGFIRPGEKAQAKFLTSLDSIVGDAGKGFRGLANGQPLLHSNALIGTLKRIDGMINGWGKHYWFCNDLQLMENLDRKISEQIRELLGMYRAAREGAPSKVHSQMLGVSELSTIEFESFKYPSIK